MRLKEILHLTLALLLLTGCSATEKFSVHVPAGTKIYTPDNTVTPHGVATNSDKVDMTVPSDMYCGYILAQSADSDMKVPIGLDYKTKRHIGDKVAFYIGMPLTIGGLLVGSVCGIMYLAKRDPVLGTMGLASLGTMLVGAAIGGPAKGRLNQISYYYNFGYEEKQVVNMPALSSTLLKPNNPKGWVKAVAAPQKESSTHRKKASSGKDVKNGVISSSKVNKTRSDYSKKIEGEYQGSGRLFSGKNIDEEYSEIAVVIKRIDKTHVSVRIIESADDYFEAPLVYEIHVNKNGGYNLNIDKLAEASIRITKSGKLTFKHKKVNIDDQIYTLEIAAQKQYCPK